MRLSAVSATNRREPGHKRSRVISVREHAGSLKLMAGTADGAWRGIRVLRDGQHLDELTCLLIGHLSEGYDGSSSGV
jgi:hypothetical protein